MPTSIPMPDTRPMDFYSRLDHGPNQLDSTFFASLMPGPHRASLIDTLNRIVLHHSSRRIIMQVRQLNWSYDFRKMWTMSVERKVGRAVLDLGDLVKSEVVQCISLAAKEGTVNLTELDVKNLARMLNATVESVFQRGVDGVLRATGSGRG
jgi:hypothetical protein